MTNFLRMFLWKLDYGLGDREVAIKVSGNSKCRITDIWWEDLRKIYIKPTVPNDQQVLKRAFTNGDPSLLGFSTALSLKIFWIYFILET